MPDPSVNDQCPTRDSQSGCDSFKGLQCHVLIVASLKTLCQNRTSGEVDLLKVLQLLPVELCDGEIEEGVSYNVDVKNEGFIGTGDRFSSIGLTESTTFAREYFLKEIVLEKEYNMPLVLYPLGSADLLINATVNSTDSLNYLVDVLERNENLVIQLEAHTDSRGTNSSNKTLSQRRAETCVNFLLDQGIASERLVPLGLGEDKLIITDAQISKLPQDEREAAHQINRRTVFKIVRFDFIPSDE